MADSQRDRVMAACAAKAGSVEDYPFSDEVAVFKVAGRMFALLPLGLAPGSVSLKCDPGLAADLRGRYAGITPGYQADHLTACPAAPCAGMPVEDVALVDAYARISMIIRCRQFRGQHPSKRLSRLRGSHIADSVRLGAVAAERVAARRSSGSALP